MRISARAREVGILNQVEDVERAAGRALGEIPRGARRGDARFGMRAVDGAVPEHRAVDGDLHVGFHQRTEAGGGELGRLTWREEAAGLTGDVHERRRRRPGLGLESQQCRGRHGVRVGHRHARVEERARRALGQIARVVALRVGTSLHLLQVGHAVRVGIGRGVSREQVEAVSRLVLVGHAVAIGIGHSPDRSGRRPARPRRATPWRRQWRRPRRLVRSASQPRHATRLRRPAWWARRRRAACRPRRSRRARVHLRA